MRSRDREGDDALRARLDPLGSGIALEEAARGRQLRLKGPDAGCVSLNAPLINRAAVVAGRRQIVSEPVDIKDQVSSWRDGFASD